MKLSNKSHIVKIQEDPETGDLFFELPEEIVSDYNLKENDPVYWKIFDNYAEITFKKD